MSGKGTFRAMVLCVVCAGLSAPPANAAPPWEKLMVLKRMEADPDKDYALGEKNGPWVIMACSFSGEGADQQAHELVLELRKRYKLPAYSHKVRFDFGKHAQGRGIDPTGAPLRMRYKSGSELSETAVLVGDYPAVDDPEGQKILQKLKASSPECLELGDGRATNRSLAGWRWLQEQVRQQAQSSDSEKQKGPMRHAFVTTNPLLPKGYFVTNGVDDLVLKMNKGVKHGLLDCPGKYTVQVAHFTGRTTIKQDEIQKVKNGAKIKDSLLAKAAEKAHRLTESLRMKGYDAYEFHDRYASIVTVGSFQSVGTPSAHLAGRTEINPNVHAVMNTFAASQTAAPGMPAGAMQPKTLAGIPFDIQPILVQVPKRSIADGR